jgi:hypothetical protein
MDIAYSPVSGAARRIRKLLGVPTTPLSLALAAATLLLTAPLAQAGLRSEIFEVAAGKEGYVGDVPMMGEACFKVVSKGTNVPARAHFRGLINGRPIDLDYHTGGRCLKFVRDGGIGLYRVYVIADGGQALTVTRTVNEKNHDWRPGPPGGFMRPPV